MGTGPRSPQASGRTQRRGGGGQQGPQGSKGCRSGARAPRSHSPLEHAGNGTGRPLRCWPGLPAVRALLSVLFLFLLLFFSLPPSSTFSLFPPLPLRGGAKRDGRAGRLTLALPLCRPQLFSSQSCHGKGFKGNTPRFALETLPAADGTPIRSWELRVGNVQPWYPAGSFAARAQCSLWGAYPCPTALNCKRSQLWEGDLSGNQERCFWQLGFDLWKRNVCLFCSPLLLPTQAGYFGMNPKREPRPNRSFPWGH